MVTVNSLRCPSWCQTDHARTDRFERYIEPELDLRTHSMDIARISNPAGNLRGEVVVDVAVTDNLTSGGREGPLVSASGAECMTPTTAVELAAGLLAAVAMLRDDPVMADALGKIGSRAGEAVGSTMPAEPVCSDHTPATKHVGDGYEYLSSNIRRAAQR